MIERIRAQFDGMDRRERLVLFAGLFAVLLTTLVYGLYQPLYGGLARAEADLAQARVDLAAAATLSGSAGRAPALDLDTEASVLAQVDRLARARGLSNSIRRLQPDGEVGVRLSLQDADFDTLLVLLGELERRHGIGLSNAALEPTGDPGRVSGSLSLIRP